MPRKAEPGPRRAQIANALLAVLAEHGVDGTTTARIAARAGLSPGLVHYYFGSKQALLAHAAGELGDALARRAAARVEAASEGARARLEAFVDALLERSDDDAPEAVGAWVALAAEAPHDDEVRNVVRGVLDGLSSTLSGLLLDAASEANAGRPATRAARRREAEARASGLLALVHGAFGLALIDSESLQSGFAAPAARAMIEGWLGPKGGR